MGRFIGGLGASVFAGLIMLVTAAGADQEKAKRISEDKLPKAVMAAIKDRFPGAKLTGIEKETENGKVVFDIELKHKDRKYEMDISEDGTIIEIEKEVAAKDLPAAVTRALEAKYPNATIKEIMEVNKVKDKKETPDHYEVVLVTAQNKTLEVEVALDGSSIKAGEAEKDKK